MKAAGCAIEVVEGAQRTEVAAGPAARWSPAWAQWDQARYQTWLRQQGLETAHARPAIVWDLETPQGGWAQVERDPEPWWAARAPAAGAGLNLDTAAWILRERYAPAIQEALNGATLLYEAINRR